MHELFSTFIPFQEVPLKNKRLLRYIIKQHKPHIYVSEWTAGRFDCGCRYKLAILGFGNNYNRDLEFALRKSRLPDISAIKHSFHKKLEETVEQWQGGAWKKVNWSEH